MTYDPKYKIKHRVTPVSRLLSYKGMPPRMVGDPPLIWSCPNSWDQRCKAVYAAMMAEKRGAVPPHTRVGLWFWHPPTDSYRQALP